MPVATKYLFVASMDVDADKEAIFHEVYDTEHVPFLLQVPGVRAVTRVEGQDFAFALAGKVDKRTHDGPRHHAIYEIDSPDVLTSPGWAAAVEKGRWPTHVRPYTRNRRHAVYKVR